MSSNDEDYLKRIRNIWQSPDEEEEFFEDIPVERPDITLHQILNAIEAMNDLFEMPDSFGCPLCQFYNFHNMDN